MPASSLTALFDIDGVLLYPGGYRAATQATLRTFLDRWGLAEVNVPEHALELFESMGVTSECDMIPLCLAVALEARFAGHLTGSISPDFDSAIRGMRLLLRPGRAAADCVLEAAKNGGGKIFPHLRGQAILIDLLAGTRDVQTSATTRLLQNFVLGSRRFEQTTGLSAEVEIESYLEQYDRVALGAEPRARLEAARRRGILHTALFTARASLPPDGQMRLGYFPEAEIARERLGLRDWPLMGYGGLQHLEECSGVSAESLLKPAPLQALAALGAAWTGEPLRALAWAGSLTDLPGCGALASRPIILPVSGEVHVFEDSQVGLRAARAAGDILRSHGSHLELHFWGVARNPDKQRALREQGARVFEDVNAALEAFFAQTGL